MAPLLPGTAHANRLAQRLLPGPALKVVWAAHRCGEDLPPHTPPSLVSGTSKLRCYFLDCVFPDHVPRSGDPTCLIAQESVHLLSTLDCVP